LSGNGAGQQKIGRQIVLPFSKAFEIAWKGIRIRIWRSLITMSGIVLAIAFLMSVWTGGVFNRALRAVPPGNEIYPVVQSALEAEAIAAGGVRVSCVVLDAQAGAPEDQITPAEAIRSFLESEGAFRVRETVPDAQKLAAVVSEELEGRPGALILAGFHPLLSEDAAAAAISRYVEEGGFVLVYGVPEVAAGQQVPLADMLPASIAGGTFTASGSSIARGQRSVDVRWQDHPAATFARTTGKPGAVPMATSEGQTILWMIQHDKGSVVWYPVAPVSAQEPDVLSWFVRGRTVQAANEGQAGAGSPMARLLVRSAGQTGARRDMRGVWLVTLSLMVCVVGITNAMLMSVTERFREIGTMKCLGALDKFVVKLFLIESSLQGVVGSLTGALVGFVLAFGRALFTFHVKDLVTGQGYWLAIRFFPGLELLLWVAIALVVGIVLSVVAAIYPAIRAARMEPVQAMRTEA
jgi:hypothetical protein